MIISELFYHSLKRLHLQHNQIRTIPFLKVLQGRQIVQEYSKTALKRKQASNARTRFLCLFKFYFSVSLSLENPSMNYFQHGLSASGDDLIKSTIFEEDEESPSNRSNPKPIVEDEDISLPAFPELQYLDISFNLVEYEKIFFNELFFCCC